MILFVLNPSLIVPSKLGSLVSKDRPACCASFLPFFESFGHNSAYCITLTTPAVSSIPLRCYAP